MANDELVWGAVAGLELIHAMAWWIAYRVMSRTWPFRVPARRYGLASPRDDLLTFEVQCSTGPWDTKTKFYFNSYKFSDFLKLNHQIWNNVYYTAITIFFMQKKCEVEVTEAKQKDVLNCLDPGTLRQCDRVWQAIHSQSWKQMWRGNHSIEQLHVVPMIKMSRSFAALMDIGFLDQFPWLKLQTLPQ